MNEISKAEALESAGLDTPTKEDIDLAFNVIAEIFEITGIESSLEELPAKLKMVLANYEMTIDGFKSMLADR